MNRVFHNILIFLAGTAIVCSAIHFWPWPESKIWQLICPMNAAILLGIGICSIAFICHRNNDLQKHFPHISICAFLLINLLSLAVTPDISRTLVYLFKLMLMYVAGYIVFSCSIDKPKSLMYMYIFGSVALLLGIGYCLASNYVLHHDGYGFHGNVFKYGTYIGILVPLCSTFMILGKSIFSRILGTGLIIGGIISSGSIGATLAIIFGSLVAILYIPRWTTKGYVLGILIAAIGIQYYWVRPSFDAVKKDAVLTEKDGVNLRQRYIEWQAELNMLEDRAILGSGAGCINEYRSQYYYRLPKLNTLKPFDLNGWLSIAAELGILGLLCFTWIILYHYRINHSVFRIIHSTTEKQFLKRCAVANIAGLTGASVANLFSSVHFHGLLIVFVFILVLSAKTYQFSKVGSDIQK